MMKIGVVIVTHNRTEKLHRCLAAYEKQILPPDILFVVDNACTDGSSEFLDQWCAEVDSGKYKRVVIHSTQNLGGAGGFALGIKNAIDYDIDWIWVADDDAYPETNCFSCLGDYYSQLNFDEQRNTVALCAQVTEPAGIAILHRRKIKRGTLAIKEIPVSKEKYNANTFEIDLFSFVGTLIRKDIILNEGLPNQEFFIWYDDSEYSLRIGRNGKMICVTDAVIYHDSMEKSLQKKSWKYYYLFRNKLYMYFHYFDYRYYLVEKCKIIYMIFKYYNCPYTWKQFFGAVQDVKRGRLGVNTKYLP